MERFSVLDVSIYSASKIYSNLLTNFNVLCSKLYANSTLGFEIELVCLQYVALETDLIVRL